MADSKTYPKQPIVLRVLVGVAIAAFVLISGLLMAGVFNPHTNDSRLNSELAAKLALSNPAR
jgi:hypothetical protein